MIWALVIIVAALYVAYVAIHWIALLIDFGKSL